MASVKSFCAKNVTPHYFLLKFITKIEINNFDAASIFRFNHLLDEWIVKFDANNVVNKDRFDDSTVQLLPKAKKPREQRRNESISKWSASSYNHDEDAQVHLLEE